MEPIQTNNNKEHYITIGLYILNCILIIILIVVAAKKRHQISLPIITTRDSIEYNIRILDSIEYNIRHKDSIVYTIIEEKNEKINEVRNLNDSASIELFKELVSGQ